VTSVGDYFIGDDARTGVITQTRRHSSILGLLGVRHVLLAVNKMDLAGFDEDHFIEVAAEYRMIATRLEIPQRPGARWPFLSPGPEITMDTAVLCAESACEHIITYLQERRYL
jgi:translation elongation factor EF-Tu-like GTPase